uniref:Uncharacterized protein n=1 Tax=Arundo donax TaxID=35708 RepID=A0A0A8ZXT7_ARUDO
MILVRFVLLRIGLFRD